MEDNELKQLEESAGIRRIVERSKVLMEQEDREMQPKPFTELMEKVERRRSALSHFTFSVWKLSAACVVGILIGWCIPESRSGNELMPVKVDTVIVTERVVDTLYQEVPVSHDVFIAKGKKATLENDLADSTEMPEQSSASAEPVHEDVLPENQEQGRSLSKENFPFHLLVSM